MQTRTLKRNSIRAAIIAALVLLTAAVLYTGLHSNDLARAWSALYHRLDRGLDGPSPAQHAELPMVKPDPPAVSDDTAWQDWKEHGKAFSNGISQVGKAISSGISQVIERHVPGAKAAVSQTLTAVDNAIRGTSSLDYGGGSYSFIQTATVIPGGGGGGWGWFYGGGGGGCWGADCGGHPPPDCHQTHTCGPTPDCHKTNSCTPPPDCHDANNCSPPPDCHQTESCSPHMVDESSSLALLCGGLLPLLLWIRRRRRLGERQLLYR